MTGPDECTSRVWNTASSRGAEWVSCPQAAATAAAKVPMLLASRAARHLIELPRERASFARLSDSEKTMKKILSALVALAFIAVAVPAIAQPAPAAAPAAAPAGETPKAEKAEKKKMKKHHKKAKKTEKKAEEAAPAK